MPKLIIKRKRKWSLGIAQILLGLFLLIVGIFLIFQLYNLGCYTVWINLIWIYIAFSSIFGFIYFVEGILNLSKKVIIENVENWEEKK